MKKGRKELQMAKEINGMNLHAIIYHYNVNKQAVLPLRNCKCIKFHYFASLLFPLQIYAAQQLENSRVDKKIIIFLSMQKQQLDAKCILTR
jgi:hypothetical protein